MKSDIRTFVRSAFSAASKKPAVATELNRNKMFRFKAAHLLLLAGLAAPLQGFATAAPEGPYCVAVGGGFGNSGSTFVARNFSMPEANKCSPWTGYTKTSATVILTTSGTSCLSSDSLALTVSVTSADPSYFPLNQLTADYIQLTRTDTTEPFTGQDYGAFAGDAEVVSCTSDQLNLPAVHD